MPDLIRLVHGNPYSKPKLIREFSIYWELKSAGKLPFEEKRPELATSSSAASATVASPMDSSSENVTPQVAAPLGSPSKLSAPATSIAGVCSSPLAATAREGPRMMIANRQLELRITSMAVYESRLVPPPPGHHSPAGAVMLRGWFVREEELAKYAKQLSEFGPMLPNSWRYVTNPTERTSIATTAQSADAAQPAASLLAPVSH